MAKAKINFEIEQEILANAKAYVATHGGSLNKLVSSFFSTLGAPERANAPLPNPATRVLMEVSTGDMSLVDGARMLGVQDAGYVLHMLRAANLPLPRLSERDARGQADAASAAFADCLRTPDETAPLPTRKTRAAVSK